MKQYPVKTEWFDVIEVSCLHFIFTYFQNQQNV